MMASTEGLSGTSIRKVVAMIDGSKNDRMVTARAGTVRVEWRSVQRVSKRNDVRHATADALDWIADDAQTDLIEDSTSDIERHGGESAEDAPKHFLRIHETVHGERKHN